MILQMPKYLQILRMEGILKGLSEGERIRKGLTVLVTTEISFTCTTLGKKFFSDIKRKMQ